MWTVDFETHQILGNPVVNPPKPVGVSLKHNDHPSKYLAWGHTYENSCTEDEAKAALHKVWTSGEQLLFHNAPFDLSVGAKHLGLPDIGWEKYLDTQYSIFLTDPYAPSFSLKPSAARILGIPPEEQEDLRKWIMHNIPEARKKPKEWGSYISSAPVSLVAPYAIGDTDRTYALHKHLHPQIVDMGSWQAYQREQQLMPILVESTKRGIRVDVDALALDVPIYERVVAQVDKKLYKLLGEINLDSDDQLAQALSSKGYVKDEDWVLTPGGKRSTSRPNLTKALRDPVLLPLLAYRGALCTCLRMFARPWLEMATAGDGRVHTQWNQVRGDRSDQTNGTRTGRLSSSGPNFQNVSNEFPDPPKGFPPVPLMRKYLLPDKGYVWLKRDFSSQEMRIMAHYAEGRLYDAYKANPATDPHEMVQGIVKDLLAIEMPRKYVKITGFGIMYGRGITNLSAALGVSPSEGTKFRDAYFTALPEVRILSRDIKAQGDSGNAIKTWGGRSYYREPHPDRNMSYKLFNYLIQGSAADQTKASIIDWHNGKYSEDQFLATVHDENNIQAPIKRAKAAMTILKWAMNRDRFEVPFLSEGYKGPNWADLKECA